MPQTPRRPSVLLRLCLAWATALIGGQAAAQSPTSTVTVNGLLDVYVGSIKRSDGTPRQSVVAPSGMTTSWWGVSGNEDLGGGLSALFAIESFIRPDTGESGRSAVDPYWARNAYVGLRHAGWGQLRLGRNANPFFGSTAIYNPFGASTGFSPILLHAWLPTYGRSVLGDTGWSNSLLYASPAWGPLSVQALYAVAEAPDRSDIRNLGFRADYATGPLAVGLAVQSVKVPFFNTTVSPAVQLGAVSGQRATHVGASWDFGSVKAFGQYLHVDNQGSDRRDRSVQAGAAVPALGVGRVLGSVAQTRYREPGIANRERTTVTLGYDHFLSRRTDVYAVVSGDKATGFASAVLVAVGLRHSF